MRQTVRGDGANPNLLLPRCTAKRSRARSSTDEVLFVLDTKYKDTATYDFAQIVAYAEKMGCENAILGYPRELPHSLDTAVGGIWVCTLSFPVNSDVDRSGEKCMDSVLNDVLVHSKRQDSVRTLGGWPTYIDY